MRKLIDGLEHGQEPPIAFGIQGPPGISILKGESVLVTFPAKALVKVILECAASERGGEWAKALQGTW